MGYGIECERNLHEAHMQQVGFGLPGTAHATTRAFHSQVDRYCVGASLWCGNEGILLRNRYVEVLFLCARACVSVCGGGGGNSQVVS